MQLLAARLWQSWHWQTGDLAAELAAKHCSSHASSPAGQLAAAGSGDGKLGYIRIATFSRQTEEKVRAALGAVGFTGWATAEVGGGDVRRLTTVREQMQKALGV